MQSHYRCFATFRRKVNYITKITFSIRLCLTRHICLQSKFQFRNQTKIKHKIEFNNYAHNNYMYMPTVNLSYDFIYYTIDNSIKRYCKDR